MVLPVYQVHKVKEVLMEYKVHLDPLEKLIHQMHILYGKIALLAMLKYFLEQAKAWGQSILVTILEILWRHK
jgi:hypothetical protein